MRPASCLLLRHSTSQFHLPFLAQIVADRLFNNRPAGFDSGVLPVTKQFWDDSYGNIRYPYGSSKQSNTLVLIHDAFQTLSYWKGFMTSAKGFQYAFNQLVSSPLSNKLLPEAWLWIPTSTRCLPIMYVFTFTLVRGKILIAILQLNAMSHAQHISTACGYVGELSTFDLWVVVGEWTPAATDCGVYFSPFSHVSDLVLIRFLQLNT